MNSKFSNSHLFAFVCGALVVAIAFGVGMSVASQHSASAAEPAQAVQQWEILKFSVSDMAFLLFMAEQYATLEEAGTAANDMLNGLGLEGWELVDVEYYETGSASLGYTVNEVFFFRRPLQPGSAPFSPPAPSDQSRNPGVG